MLDFIKFFSKVSEFPCPELFEDELEGFKKLENIWDILSRIQKGFVGSKVQPQILGEVKEGAILDGDDIYIGKGSVVHPGALIKGPTIIGENVEIRHSAFVRGNVIIGDNAVVGHCTEIVRSVMLPGAKAPHFNYVGDSILGTGVNLGAGTFGHFCSGAMTNNQEFYKIMEKASEQSCEKIWQLPVFDDYLTQISSDIADLENSGGSPAGSITAAIFLKQFVGQTPWIHLDIAGTAWMDESTMTYMKNPFLPKEGGTGAGTRLLYHLAEILSS
jgi:hypothetical protein